MQKDILSDKGKHPIIFEPNISESSKLYCDGNTPKLDKNKIVFGNYSRFAPNWASGPKHMIRHHRLPGYTGHIKGLVSENLFSETYGNSTAKAITKTHAIGHDLKPANRYKTQFKDSFKPKNFRRFIDKPELQTRRDYEDYSIFINDVYHSVKEDSYSKTMDSFYKTKDSN